MNVLSGILIITCSFLLGILLDIGFNVDIPALYWLLGIMSGIISVLIANKV